MAKKWFVLLTIYIFLLTAPVIAESFTSARVKDILQNQFSKALNRSVEIGELGGNLYNRVELLDVTIYDNLLNKDVLFYAEKIEVRYSLKGLLLDQNNLLNNISRLTIEKPWIKIIRTKQGDFNVLGIGENKKSNKNNDSANSNWGNMDIIINNGKGFYTDFRGWGATPISEPFIKELKAITGIASIKQNNLTFEFKSELPVQGKYSNLLLKGGKKLLNSEFFMTLNISDIDVDKWANYTAPMPDIFTAKRGIADLEIILEQKANNKDFLYEINLNLKNADIDLPILLKKRLTNIYGGFSIKNDYLGFKNLRGNLLKVPVVLNGSLVNFARLKTNIKVKAKNLPAQYLDRYIERTPSLPVDGYFDVNMKIVGLIEQPRIKGSFKTNKASLLGMTLKNGTGFINLYGNNLYLKLNQAKLYKGDVTLSGNITLNSNNPSFDLHATIAKAQGIDIFDFDNFKGIFSGKIAINGPLNNLKLLTSSSSSNLDIFNQNISAFNGIINKVKDDYHFKDFHIVLNNKLTTINGLIKDYSSFDFDVANNSFNYFNQALIETPFAIHGLITANLKGDFDNINNLKTQGVMSIDNSLFLGETGVSGDIRFTSKGDKLTIENSLLHKNKNTIVANGWISSEGFDFILGKKSIIDLSSLNFFKRLLPGILIDTQSSLTGQLSSSFKDYNIHLAFNTKTAIIHKEIFLEKARGEFILKDKVITFKDLLLENKDEQYKMEVSFPAKKKISLQDNIFIDISFSNASIKNINKFYRSIQETIHLSKISQEPLKKTSYKISLSNPYLLYRKNSTQGLLNKFLLYKKTFETIDLFNEALLPNGLVNGSLFFNWTTKEVFLNSNLQVNDFSYGSITAKNIFFNFETKDKQVVFNTKAYNLSNKYTEIAESEVTGKYIGGSIYFDEFNLKINDKKYSKVISGSFPLAGYWDSSAGTKNIDIAVNMPKDSINILSLLAGIKDIHHNGILKVDLKGTFNHPVLSSGIIKIDNLRVDLTQINKKIRLMNGAIIINDNALKINDIQTVISNQKNDKTSISLSAKGSTLIKNLSFKNFKENIFNINLAIDDTSGRIDLENLYSGEVKLSNLGLFGVYNSATSSNINFSGNIKMQNGIILLPKIKESGSNKNLLLDIKLDFGENVAIRQGKNIIEGDLSKIVSEINIFVNPRKSSFTVKGPINDPNLNGNIFFDEGFIKFLNRDFYFISREQQQPYLRNYPGLIRENQLIMDSSRENPFSFHLRSEAVIFNQATTTENTETTININVTPLENRFVFLIDGSLIKLGSFTFIKYKIENNDLIEVGQPYYLKDPDSNKLIDDTRFQELVYDLAPAFLKNPSQDTGRELARDIFFSEINQYFKSIVRPYEKLIAKQTGLYDVRVKGDFAQETARMLNIEEETAFQTYHNKLALELIYELYKKKLYFTLDTTLDQLNSYKITWYILTHKYIDNLSANFGNEYDYYRQDYTPRFSLEINDAF